jgi:acylphosphatase
MDKRYHMFFSGDVQNVGFRSTAKFIAIQHSLKGVARNLGDGRVEIIVEGNDHALADFYCDMKHHFKAQIKQSEARESRAVGGFTGFTVEY